MVSTYIQIKMKNDNVFTVKVAIVKRQSSILEKSTHHRVYGIFPPDDHDYYWSTFRKYFLVLGLLR